MKQISILGSTGSIGMQTLDIIREYPDKYKVCALSAGKNVELLANQVNEFNPDVVSIYSEKDTPGLKKLIRNKKIKIIYGEEGNKEVATAPEADLLVSSIVGFKGLIPTYEALKKGKNVALANKESLVVAGELLISASKSAGVRLFPIDSEHSAIFQLLNSERRDFLKRVIITASGGPFRKTPRSKMKDITVKDALNHPTWKMGRKITIDSATLMNKGFEVIEAKWFFDIPVDNIDVWIHPQSIVHSLIEYTDGTFLAHMGAADMRIPIAYSLSYPERLNLGFHNISPSDFTNLTFEEVDTEKFESIKVAIESIKKGGTFPAVLNGANEVAVNAFLDGKIKFTDIIDTVIKIMGRHKKLDSNCLDNILEADNWARSATKSIIYN